VRCSKCRNLDAEPLCRCREENSRNRKEAKRSRRYYERRDNPFFDDSDIDEIESEPLIVVYPDIDEDDPAFVAVELDQRGNEHCRVFHRGKEAAMWSCDFPPCMGTIRGLGEGLQDCEFKNRLWRHCRAAAAKRPGATASGTTVVHNAVDAGAALQWLVQGWTKVKSSIMVDPAGGCVSYQHDDCCIIFSVGSEDPVRFVQVSGLPPSFIELKQAQFIADPINHFQKNRVYVWAPPPGTNGARLVFGLSISTAFCHEDYGDFGEPEMFVAYVQVHENDPAFHAVELDPESWYAPRCFLQ
jgi:hypothetical protein